MGTRLMIPTIEFLAKSEGCSSDGTVEVERPLPTLPWGMKTKRTRNLTEGCKLGHCTAALTIIHRRPTSPPPSKTRHMRTLTHKRKGEKLLEKLHYCTRWQCLHFFFRSSWNVGLPPSFPTQYTVQFLKRYCQFGQDWRHHTRGRSEEIQARRIDKQGLWNGLRREEKCKIFIKYSDDACDSCFY